MVYNLVWFVWWVAIPFAARSQSAVIPFLRITLAFLSTLYCQLPRSTFFRFVAIGLNAGLDLGQREEGEKGIRNETKLGGPRAYPAAPSPTKLRHPRARRFPV
jgi:hypothetical protein